MHQKKATWNVLRCWSSWGSGFHSPPPLSYPYIICICSHFFTQAVLISVCGDRNSIYFCLLTSWLLPFTLARVLPKIIIRRNQRWNILKRELPFVDCRATGLHCRAFKVKLGFEVSLNSCQCMIVLIAEHNFSTLSCRLGSRVCISKL